MVLGAVFDVHIFNCLPHLTVLLCFLVTLKSMRISSVELTVREFVRLSKLLLHLSSCRQQGDWLTEPLFSTSILLPSYWLSVVIEYSWSWVALMLSWFLFAPISHSMHSRCSAIGAYSRAPPPMDLVPVESRLSE